METTDPPPSPPDCNAAAMKVQAAWRCYINKAIFRFYRDLINFREKADPLSVLKTINPQEAAMVDRSFGIHVRFRLGGTLFPPMIFYKIFTHSSLVDVNAFAPRDYVAERRIPADKVKARGKFAYCRSENNGWRPVADRIVIQRRGASGWDQTGDVGVPSSSSDAAADDPDVGGEVGRNRQLPNFHPLKTIRREERARLKKMKKLQWMMKMYRQGLVQERQDEDAVVYVRQLNQQREESGLPDLLQQFGLEPRTSLAFAGPEIVAPDGAADIREAQQSLYAAEHILETLNENDWDAFEKRAEELVQWTKGLRFDEYAQDWFFTAAAGIDMQDVGLVVQEKGPAEFLASVPALHGGSSSPHSASLAAPAGPDFFSRSVDGGSAEPDAERSAHLLDRMRRFQPSTVDYVGALTPSPKPAAQS